MNHKKTDKVAYNEHYKENVNTLYIDLNKSEYVKKFKQHGLSPYYIGGNTKGYVRGLALKKMLDEINLQNLEEKDLTILDAGSGLGELTTYLACLGFNVVSVDISMEAIKNSKKLAKSVGVEKNCKFLAESLEHISVEDSSIDYIIGHASLHHFIKYEKIPLEFNRILKTNRKAFFADSFGENKAYHIFHNKETMERLGDVILTKKLIHSFFKDFKVTLVPTDWFVMIDKLLLKIFPNKLEKVRKLVSRLFFYLDRCIPSKYCRPCLFFSGAVLTTVEKLEK